MRLLILILLFGGLSLRAQSLKLEADNLFQNQKWEDAVHKYQKYLKENPKDSSGWFKIGVSLVNLGKSKAAITSLNTAKNTGFFPGPVYYHISRAHVLNKNRELAMAALAQAADAGFSNFKILKTDPIWDSYQKDETFQQLFHQIEINAFPCLGDVNRQHFKFWIGEWDVFVNGTKVGQNTITLEEGGCVIHEAYTTSGSFSGQSFNYVDPLDKKWHQLWVSSTGNVLDYIEINRAEGMLQLQCDYLSPQNSLSKSRLTFTKNEDGTVRQFFENSTDGENWVPAFDGLYKRKLNQ